MKAHFISFLLVVFVCMASVVWAQPPVTYSGFPTLDAGDGRFAALTRGQSSLGDFTAANASMSICVDGTTETILSVWLFDGEIGPPWDPTQKDPMTWKLFPDPDLVGNKEPGDLLVSIPAAGLANDAWEEIINRALDPEALLLTGTTTTIWLEVGM